MAKTLKKCVLPLLLLLSMYLYVLIAILIRKYFGPLAYETTKLFWIYCAFVVAVYIPNLVYPFILAKRGEKSTFLLFWDMLLKLCNIPVYALIFLAGVGLSIHGIGIFFLPFFIIFDYLLLIPSSMYGVGGLLRACREGKITRKAAVMNGIAHFFFCLDVISAVVMFCLVKAKSRKQPEQLPAADCGQ